MEYEYINIDELKPYEKNARTHSEQQIETICNSIREFGFRNPVIIDENNMILAGHGRVMAAKQMGLEKVPFVRWEDMTETQKRGFILANNKTADLAGWDFDILQDELQDINLDMSDFGFDDISEPGIDELEENDGVIENNTSKPVAVKIVFEDSQKWRSMENEVRDFVDKLKGVTVSVGMHDADQ